MLQRYIRRPQQVFFRRVNFQIHLWAGIILTLYILVIGVSGSILVFRPEIERLSALTPWQNTTRAGTVADIVTVVRKISAAYPHAHLVSVDAPTNEHAYFIAILDRRTRLRLACAPDDGHILGALPTTRTWMNIMLDLHETLLIHPGSRGRMLNGLGAASLLLLNLTGLVIWWPGIRSWKRALQVDFRRNWRRINFDLHVAVGFWTILITSVWGISGIYFGWPRQIFLFVNSFSRVVTARPPNISVIPEDDTPDVDLSSVIAQAHKIDPDARLGGITFPYGRRAPLAILMRRREAPGYEYVDTVYFNPYTGDYISTWRYGVNQSLGDWIIWSQAPLHFGTYWGLGVKVIWAIAGLCLPLLAITGLLMYWNRALRRRWKQLQRPPASRTPAIKMSAAY